MHFRNSKFLTKIKNLWIRMKFTWISIFSCKAQLKSSTRTYREEECPQILKQRKPFKLWNTSYCYIGMNDTPKIDGNQIDILRENNRDTQMDRSIKRNNISKSKYLLQFILNQTNKLALLIPRTPSLCEIEARYHLY